VVRRSTYRSSPGLPCCPVSGTQLGLGDLLLQAFGHEGHVLHVQGHQLAAAQRPAPPHQQQRPVPHVPRAGTQVAHHGPLVVHLDASFLATAVPSVLRMPRHTALTGSVEVWDG
jgi:hypothetical protein